MYGIAPPNMSDISPWDTGYMPIHLSEALTVLYSFFVYLSLLDYNCTICKYFSDSIRFFFLITKFAVEAFHLHINLIAYSIVMRDLLGVLSVYRRQLH